MSDDHSEDRLRVLLRDDRWSLRPWPDVEPRVHRAARRQRLIATGLAAGASAAVIAAVVVSLTLLGGGQPAPVTALQPGTSPPVSPNRHAKPHHRELSLPPVGAPGFPASIYPPPRPEPLVNSIGHCPAAEGIRAFTAGSSAAARGLIPKLGHSFARDLRLTDRTLWPTVISGWQPGGSRAFTPSRSRPVLYSGPLESYHSSEGPPDFTKLISAGCGTRIARDTWMIVDGPRTSPALQGEWLFVNRHGHVLLYYDQ